MLQVSDRLREMIRHQVPNPGTDLASNPMETFLAALAEKVNQLDGEVPRVLSVTLSAADTSLHTTTDPTETVNATVVTQGGASTALTWTSSAPAVATVSSAGLVTAVAVGTAVIRATSVFSPTVFGEITFTVTA